MKKLGFLVLMCVLAFGLYACGGNSSSGSSQDYSDSKYVGTWEVDTISLKDQSEKFDTEWKITLEADGTGISESEDETDDFTWEPVDNGFKTKGGIKATFVDDGDGIKTEMLGAELHFNKA